MRPFFESGAQSSRSSRLGPEFMKPGEASTTHGGPSAILRSHPRVPGTFVICLVTLHEPEEVRQEPRYVLEYKGVVAFGESCSDI